MGKLILNYKFLNGIFFYIAWYACIYGAALDWELLGVCTTLVILGLHFLISKKRKNDLMILGMYLVVGIVGDWALLATQVIHYPFITYDLTMLGVPLWIIMIYASFAITMNHSMVFLHRYPLISSILGGIGGSISYYLAARIGAIELPLGWGSLVAIAVYWFGILLLSKWFHDFLERKLA